MPIVPTFLTTDVELLPVPDVIFKNISEGKFSSRELYPLRLLSEHALLVSGFDELVLLLERAWAGFEALRLKNRKRNW
jgi:hypothetical protein